MGLGRRRAHVVQRLRADLAAERALSAALTAGQPSDAGVGEPVDDVVAAARALTAAAGATADLRVIFTPRVQTRTVTATLAAQLLGALRESLANVVRHARARTLTVDLELAVTGATLCVSDDGCGLPGPTSNHGGLGRLRDRSARLGGWCLTHDRDGGAGSGTVVVWHVPAPGPATARSAPEVAGVSARLADAIGPLVARLAIAHGADRLAVTADALRRLVAADCFVVFGAVPDGHSLQVLRTAGFDRALDPVGAVVPRLGSLPWLALSSGCALRVGSLGSLPTAARHLGPLPLGAGLVVPMRRGAQPLTALGLARTTGRPGFVPAEVDAAVALAAVGSAMLDLQPVQAVIDAWPSAEFDYTDAVSVAGFPNVPAEPRNVRR